MFIETGEWPFQWSCTGTRPWRMVRNWLARKKKKMYYEKRSIYTMPQDQLRTKYVLGILRKSPDWTLDWVSKNSGIKSIIWDRIFQG